MGSTRHVRKTKATSRENFTSISAYEKKVTVPTGRHSGIEYRPAHQDDQRLTNQSTIGVGKVRYSLNRIRISVQLRSQSHFAPVANGSKGPHLSGRPRCGFRVARVTRCAPLVMVASCAMSMDEGPPPMMRISSSGRSSADLISQLCLMGNVAVSSPSNLGMKGRFSRPVESEFVMGSIKYQRKRGPLECIFGQRCSSPSFRRRDTHISPRSIN
jgi:hypothetical protein